MTSPLLVKANAAGRDIAEVTPERAGWVHVGFLAQRLKAGESETRDTGARELCLVVLTGRVDVEIDGRIYAGLGGRTSVFEEISPAAIYVPAGRQVSVRAASDAELAWCSAPADNLPREVRLLEPAAMRRSARKTASIGAKDAPQRAADCFDRRRGGKGLGGRARFETVVEGPGGDVVGERDRVDCVGGPRAEQHRRRRQ